LLYALAPQHLNITNTPSICEGAAILPLMLGLNPLPVGDFPLVYPQRKPTVRVCTNPRFEKYRGPFLTVIR